MLTDQAVKDELHSLAEGGVGDGYVAALLTFGGELGRDDKGYYLFYSTPDYRLALEFAEYVKKEYSYAVEVGMIRPKDKRRHKLFSVEVRGRYALSILTDLGKVKAQNGVVLSLDNGVRSRISSQKEASEYARGVFLSVGSISRAAGSLRVTLTFELEDAADAFSQFLLRQGIEMKKQEKDGKFCLSTRKAQAISDLFALIGATKSVLSMQDMIVKSEARNKILRAEQLNVANLDKSMVAAVKQYNDVRLIKERRSFLGLPCELVSVAEARLANPELSLDALREILPEPISKSGLYHRFEKLAEIANEIRGKEE